MKEHIVYADYNSETGISKMEKVNKYGVFRAVSHVHEEDADIANRWDGLRFCEYKIDIQVMQAKTRILRERANGIQNAIMAINPPDPDEEDYTWEKMLNQLADAKWRYAEAETRLHNMKKNYHEFVDRCLATRKKVRAYNKEQ